MKISRFEDIEGWRKARVLTRGIYQASERGNFRRDFSLRDQIRRAFVSVMANVAEGYGSYTDKEFIRFLYYAKGSASEVQSHLYVALDIGYINQSTLDELYKTAEDCKRLIGGFIRYLDME